MPKEDEDNNLNNKKIISSTLIANKTESLTAGKKQQKLQQQQLQEQQDYSHRGENPHSKNTDEQTNESEKELNNEHLKRDLKPQIKDELEKQEKGQQILLKENKQPIIDFLLDNKDSIRVEDLKIYEPIYKCYRKKGHCLICNKVTNIICVSCNNHNNEVWLCTDHWKQHIKLKLT